MRIMHNFPEERIVAIIEPHGYKRTKALLAQYKGVFDSVDKVIIGPIFVARDEADASITSQKIAKVSCHPKAVGCDSLVEILENLKKEIEDCDVIVVMGAGKSDRWAREVLKINTDT
jgi:UDP-N-acetylmuramate--alanine ligase